MSSHVKSLLHPAQDLVRWWRAEHSRVRELHDAGRMTIDQLPDLEGALPQAVPTWRRLQSLY